MKSLERGGICTKPSSLDPHGASLTGLLRSTEATVWREQPEQPVRAMHCEKQARRPRTIMPPTLRRGPSDLVRGLANRLPPLHRFLTPKDSSQGSLGAYKNIANHADHWIERFGSA